MEFNADELVSPTWMDKAFFEKVLQSSENDKTIIVKNIIVSPGTKPGEHYASIMFRITIDFESKKSGKRTKKVVLKTTPLGEGIKMDFLKNSKAFDNEIGMYSKTLNEMDRVLKAAGETFTLAPRFLYHTFEPQPVIVLQDISPQGYVMLGKQANLEQSFMVMTRLAKFHAVSIFLNENNGNVQKYNKSLYTDESELMDRLFKDNVHIFTNELKTWGPEYQIYYEKFNKLKDDITKLGKHLLVKNEDDNGYNVLNHGDFNANNVLVKWDAENKIIEDFILIDYQVCFWASPAIDILNGLYLMMDSEVRNGHRAEIITHYHNEFTDTLKKLGYLGKIPSLLDLNLELMKKGEYEVVLAVCFLQYFFIDHTKDDFQMEDFFKPDDEGKKARSFRNPEYLKAIRRELPAFLHKGFLR